MEWFLVGLGAGEAIETVTGESSISLTVNPSDEGLDGTMYTCRATTSDGQAVEEIITLSVEGSVNIYCKTECVYHDACILIIMLQPLRT